MKSRHGLIRALLALTLLVAVASPTIAADRYGVVGITNETKITVNFEYKVGDGEWTAKSIAPGQKLWFSHRYDKINENKSPPFYVRFDSDLRGGKNFTTEYKLAREASPDQSYEQSKKHAFQYEPANNKFIDLKVLR